MKFIILQIILFSILFIFIIHFLIKQILLQNYKYKSQSQNKLPEIRKDVNKNQITEINEEFNPLINSQLNDEDMKQYLLDYMKENNEIYENKTDIYLQDNEEDIIKGFNKYQSNLSNNELKNENADLQQYFKPVVDIQKEIKVPNYDMSQKIISQQNLKENTWEYQNENIMNGAEFGNGIHGWDGMNTNSLYSDLNTDIKCSNQ